MSEPKCVSAKKNDENVEAQAIQKEKNEAQAIKEVTDESLEKVAGGVQPRPKQGCHFCNFPDGHASYCPMREENKTTHL